MFDEVIALLEGKKVVATHSGKQIVVMEIPNAKLWPDESPNLYSCHVAVLNDGKILDETVETLGIRSCEGTPQKGLLINGKPVKLRGACGIVIMACLALPPSKRRRSGG